MADKGLVTHQLITSLRLELLPRGAEALAAELALSEPHLAHFIVHSMESAMKLLAVYQLPIDVLIPLRDLTVGAAIIGIQTIRHATVDTLNAHGHLTGLADCWPDLVGKLAQ